MFDIRNTPVLDTSANHCGRDIVSNAELSPHSSRASTMSSASNPRSSCNILVLNNTANHHGTAVTHGWDVRQSPSSNSESSPHGSHVSPTSNTSNPGSSSSMDMNSGAATCVITVPYLFLCTCGVLGQMCAITKSLMRVILVFTFT